MCLFGWLVGLRGQTGQTENLSAKDYIFWNTKCSDCLPTRKSVVLRGFEETNSCGVHFFSDIWITLPPKAPVIRLILGDPCPFWRSVLPPQATEKGYCLRFLGGAVSLSWSAQSSGFLGGGGLQQTVPQNPSHLICLYHMCVKNARERRTAFLSRWSEQICGEDPRLQGASALCDSSSGLC